jgi:hypothetical protein
MTRNVGQHSIVVFRPIGIEYSAFFLTSRTGMARLNAVYSQFPHSFRKLPIDGLGYKPNRKYEITTRCFHMRHITVFLETTVFTNDIYFVSTVCKLQF